MENPPSYEQSAGGNPQNNEASTSISFNLGFIRTPPGLLLIINLILLFLSWCIMAGWRSETHKWFEVVEDDGRSGFYLAATVIPWLVFVLVFVLMMFNLHTRISRIINFQVTLMVNCAIWAVLLFIATCIIADLARKADKYDCSVVACGHLIACTVFGFIESLCLAAQTFLHFREWRSG